MTSSFRGALRAGQLLLIALVVLSASSCGSNGDKPVIDADSATWLPNATPTEFAIGSDGVDVLLCNDPYGVRLDPRLFRVTVVTKTPGSVALQVGILTWKYGVQWPDWQTVTRDDRLEVSDEILAGLLVIEVRGEPGSGYSITVDWPKADASSG